MRRATVLPQADPQDDAALAALVVEDSLLVRRALRTMLIAVPAVRRIGAVGCAEDALMLLGPRPRPRFQLLVTDLQLPRMGGIELLTEVRRRYGDAAPTLLVVSATSEDEGVRAALAGLGVARVFGKPLSRTQFVKACAAAIPAR